MKITEDYVSFEIAKLLREKGFNWDCIATYSLSSKQFNIEEVYQDWTLVWSSVISAPTLQMACKWLREVYDLHITAYPYKALNKKKYCCQVYKTFNMFGCEKYTNERLDSYEEAVEAALKYVLENLI